MKEGEFLTVPNTKTKIIYLGNGLNRQFAVPFAFLDPSCLLVVLIDEAGQEHVLLHDYFADMLTKTVLYPGYPPGTEPPLAEQPPLLPTGARLLICRRTPKTQETDLPGQTVLDEIERMDDKAMQCIQELNEEIARAVIFPLSLTLDGHLPLPVVPGASVCVNGDATGLRYGANPDEAMATVAQIRHMLLEMSWLLNNLFADAAFTLDSRGGLMPRMTAAETTVWGIDANGDLYIKKDVRETFYFGIDENGDTEPRLYADS